jgi:fructose-bisphosphate aldolase class 1
MLDKDLHKMSLLFREREMAEPQLDEYLYDLMNYQGFDYTFAELRASIAHARQKHEVYGALPTVAVIMKKFNPRA